MLSAGHVSISFSCQLPVQKKGPLVIVGLSGRLPVCLAEGQTLKQES
jgi:hypothetical protein